MHQQDKMSVSELQHQKMLHSKYLVLQSKTNKKMRQKQKGGNEGSTSVGLPVKEGSHKQQNILEVKTITPAEQIQTTFYLTFRNPIQFTKTITMNFSLTDVSPSCF